MFLKTPDKSEVDMCSRRVISRFNYMLISHLTQQEVAATEAVLLQANKAAKWGTGL